MTEPIQVTQQLIEDLRAQAQQPKIPIDLQVLYALLEAAEKHINQSPPREIRP